MSPRHCGLFIIRENDTIQRRSPLKSINVTASSCGPIVQNIIKFQYKNTNDVAIQTKFIFPVDSQSCIYHLSAIVCGRTIVGKVMEKRVAKRVYDAAVAAGKSSVLAKESEESSDIIELELGAFGANEEAEITIKEILEMRLVKRGTRFQYKFPTSLFVRYGDTITSAASQNTPTKYTLNFELTSQRGVSKIIPKPWLGNNTEGAVFSFNDNRKVFEKDHDVVLDLVLSSDFKGLKLIECSEDPTCIGPGDCKAKAKVMLSSILVHVPATPLAELPAKEYVFVVDCSGSMRGDRVEAARKTLQQLINSLPVGSYFNVVRFGSRFESLFREPKEYNKGNKEIAIKLAETLDANLGGTELLNCLNSVLKCRRQIGNYKRQIFVLTDGGIDNQDATLKLVKECAATNRVFSFGIGSGCSTSLVNGLADAGMGAASFITDQCSGSTGEEQESLPSICIKSLMASASQHMKIKISPEPKAPKSHNNMMLVDSSCVNVFHDGIVFDVSLVLTLSNNQEEEVVTYQDTTVLETIESPFQPNVLHKLSVKKMMGEMGDDIEAIIEMSVKEQVLSTHTAFVGVADDEKTVVGFSQRVDIRPSGGATRSRGPGAMACGKRRAKKNLRKKRRSAGVVIMPSQSTSMVEYDEKGSHEEAPVTKTEQSPAPGVKRARPSYQSITNKQNPDGHWSEKLEWNHKDLFKNIESSFSDDKSIQFTLYAVLLLLVDFTDTFNEWKLTAVKGITFLKKSIVNLVDEILKLLSLSNLEVDEENLSDLLC